MIKKKCAKCKKLKTLTEFGKYSRALDGLKYECKACVKICMATYMHSKAGLISGIYGSQRRSSKNRGHPPPSYSKHELTEWMESQCNFDMLYLNWINSGWNKMKIPSVDRANDYESYTLDNLLRICTWQENKDRGHADIKNGINNKINKAVIQGAISGELVAEHHSVSQAARATGIDLGNISSACRGKLKSAGGFAWKYSAQLESERCR